jgi:flavin-binding protein dodecin
MPESVYKVIELVGTSTESWDRAAAAGVELASKSLRDLRVAEVTQLDVHILDGGQLVYRAKLKVSFKYESGDDLPPPRPAKKPRAAKKAAPPPPPPPEEAPAPAKKAPRKGKKKG